MNCTEIAIERIKESPKKTAIWTPKAVPASFGDIGAYAACTQNILHKRKIAPGDSVLIAAPLIPETYGAILGILAFGCSVVFVEPWMPLRSINRVIDSVSPKLFITGFLGKVWGLRSKNIRQIPNWININTLTQTKGEIHVESVDENSKGIITFTTGTTGEPKGVLRHQKFLIDQHRIISKELGLENHTGPDLCIFANFVLANLTSGRTSILMPPKWKKSTLKQIDDLKNDLAPTTLTCGPAFLDTLIKNTRLRTLESIHVGGALADCSLFKKAFSHWDNTHFSHVYGSTEAEPVAHIDAKLALQKSEERGYSQLLCLGTPIGDIEAKHENGLWVTGPHVCPKYVGNDEENRANKKTDDAGRVWHYMGDRIEVENGEEGEIWWYSGRSGQDSADFALEQKIYAYLNDSNSFIVKTADNKPVLVGERLNKRRPNLESEFPTLSSIVEVKKVYRDRRHRARLDRPKTLKKGAPWLAG